MNGFLALPTGPLAEAGLALVRKTVSASVADHSIRSFLFARLIAVHEGSDGDAAYDEDLLFASCVLHDLGLGTLAAGRARFEVEGADLAAALLTEHGVPAPDVDRVWEAIALHSSHGIADRRGLLAALTYRGVFMDAGRGAEDLPGVQRRRVYAGYPRPAADHSVRDAIIAHAKRSDSAAPPYTIAAELLRQAEAGG